MIYKNLKSTRLTAIMRLFLLFYAFTSLPLHLLQIKIVSLRFNHLIAKCYRKLHMTRRNSNILRFSIFVF